MTLERLTIFSGIAVVLTLGGVAAAQYFDVGERQVSRFVEPPTAVVQGIQCPDAQVGQTVQYVFNSDWDPLASIVTVVRPADWGSGRCEVVLWVLGWQPGDYLTHQYEVDVPMCDSVSQTGCWQALQP